MDINFRVPASITEFEERKGEESVFFKNSRSNISGFFRIYRDLGFVGDSSGVHLGFWLGSFGSRGGVLLVKQDTSPISR